VGQALRRSAAPDFSRQASKLKALLGDFGARTRDALDDAIRRAMDLIDGADSAAWFAHCGYSGQLK